jgi:hypothetical protein
MKATYAQNFDFGIFDYLIQRMTFDSQDFLRILVGELGRVCAFQVNIGASFGGLVKSLQALEKDCIETNSDFKKLITTAKLVKNEITFVLDKHLLNYESVLKNQKDIKVLKKWVIIEFSNNLAIDDESLKYVGAFFSLALSGYKLAQQLVNTLFRLMKDGKEFINDKQQKDLARLLNRAHQVFGLKEKSLTHQIRSHYYFKSFYASIKERQSVSGWAEMTKSEYLESTSKIYREVKDGNSNALINALTLILGLPTHLAMQIPLFNKHSDDWLIVIDLDQGLVLFDLSEIFPHGAKIRNRVESFEQSSSVLVKPLPKYIKDELVKHYLGKPKATNLRDLIGEFDVSVDRNQVSRLLNTTGKFAINSCGIDPFNASVISGDFRGIATAKAYYRRTTRQTVWDSSNRLYESIGWGNSVDYVDGLAFGSKVVAKDEVLIRLFSDLSEKIKLARPSNRCGVRRLLEFHNIFCVYSATFAIFTLALRNANPISICSCDFPGQKRYIVIDDKHVLGAASGMPVAITHSLFSQLTYWRVHCKCLLERLQKMNYIDQKFMLLLDGVVYCKNTPLFVMTEKPYAASVARVATSWSVPLVENFSRHLWESKFSQVGISSRFSGAHLRHQSSGVLSWASDSDFILVDFIDAISSAQEQVLRDLKIVPIHGLNKR